MVEAAVVVLGLILWAVKGAGSVLVMDIADPIVVLFDDISAICNDVAVVPPNDASVLPSFTTITALGLGSSLGNGSEVALVVKSFASTVVSTLAEASVVVVGLILWAVKGTGTELAMDIFDSIVVLLDDISAICTDVAAPPPRHYLRSPPQC